MATRPRRSVRYPNLPLRPGQTPDKVHKLCDRGPDCPAGVYCQYAHSIDRLKVPEQEEIRTSGWGTNGQFSGWQGPCGKGQKIPNPVNAAATVRKAKEELQKGVRLPSWVPGLDFEAFFQYGDDYLRQLQTPAPPAAHYEQLTPAAHYEQQEIVRINTERIERVEANRRADEDSMKRASKARSRRRSSRRSRSSSRRRSRGRDHHSREMSRRTSTPPRSPPMWDKGAQSKAQGAQSKAQGASAGMGQGTQSKAQGPHPPFQRGGLLFS